MKYCADTTKTVAENINAVSYLQRLTEIIKSEGGTDDDCILFYADTHAINGDDLEKCTFSIRGLTELQSSMDIAVGLRNSETNAIEVLLVELKLKIRNTDSIEKRNMEAKVSGSSLHFNQAPIHEKYIFIFNNHFIQQAINRFRRINPPLGGNYVPATLEQLKDQYF
ncbi:MAG: hypothetical protein EBX41_05140 [Chitinophagia bacterium]|nr:hypothetical protein [Chitinophagia bacterium]